jgi:hypothetical protein
MLIKKKYYHHQLSSIARCCYDKGGEGQIRIPCFCGGERSDISQSKLENTFLSFVLSSFFFLSYGLM